MVEAGDEPQRRRLAAAGRAEQRHELALLEAEVDPVERDHGPEDPSQGAELEEGHQRASPERQSALGGPRPISRSESIAAQVMPKLSSETAAAG